MKLVVVGGHSRQIGKTAVAAAIIAATRELGWTALKLTSHGHPEGGVEDPEHPVSITREEDRRGRTDSSRFLIAGALESYWVRAPRGRLADAMPAIERIISDKPCVIMESNSVLRFLRPDLYLAVLDWNTPDFKPTALQSLECADAFVLLETARQAPAWEDVPLSVIERRPVFRVRPPDYCTPEMMVFLRSKLQ